MMVRLALEWRGLWVLGGQGLKTSWLQLIQPHSDSISGLGSPLGDGGGRASWKEVGSKEPAVSSTLEPQLILARTVRVTEGKILRAFCPGTYSEEPQLILQGAVPK